jgi:hypothetical protein
MSKLYIVGDSFSADSTTLKDTTPVWYRVLAERLGVDQIINNSIIGAAQDFSWYSLQNWRNYITSDDYLVVVLTHPGRFWFIENDPSTAKYDNVHGYESQFPPNVATAIKMYIEYIQRPTLDTVWLENRLAWLAYNTHLCKWRKPLIILGFTQDISQAVDYPDIQFSNGSLTDHVANPEIKIPPNFFNSDKDFENYIKILDEVNNGVDVRHNHMCISNHAILADKVYESLVNNVTLDLTSGFEYEIFNKTTANDAEFVKNQLDEGAVADKISKTRQHVGVSKFFKYQPSS